MILPSEKWMDLRRYRSLHQAGATYKQIAEEVGCDWRTVRKYLGVDAPSGPPRAPSRAGTQPRKIEPFVQLIDAWLLEDRRLRASVIHERLVGEHGFDGHYQRVKNYVREARARLQIDGADRPGEGLHRRFGVHPGAQAQVDWGHEAPGWPRRWACYSFHMVLSYSRDPFCCFTLGVQRHGQARRDVLLDHRLGAVVDDRARNPAEVRERPGVAGPESRGPGWWRSPSPGTTASPLTWPPPTARPPEGASSGGS